MWVSLPMPEQEFAWLKEISQGWRLSQDQLWRQSNVELAVVLESAWERWALPNPAGPIISVDVETFDAADAALQAGAAWASPPHTQPWGVVAGLLRLPSGLYVELLKRDAQK